MTTESCNSSQVEWEEYNWPTKHLLCQDVILHQTMDTIDNGKHMETSDYANQTNKQCIRQLE